jgi:hypothetical protein
VIMGVRNLLCGFFLVMLALILLHPVIFSFSSSCDPSSSDKPSLSCHPAAHNRDDAATSPHRRAISHC